MDLAAKVRQPYEARLNLLGRIGQNLEVRH